MMMFVVDSFVGLVSALHALMVCRLVGKGLPGYLHYYALAYAVFTLAFWISPYTSGTPSIRWLSLSLNGLASLLLLPVLFKRHRLLLALSVASGLIFILLLVWMEIDINSPLWLHIDREGTNFFLINPFSDYIEITDTAPFIFTRLGACVGGFILKLDMTDPIKWGLLLWLPANILAAKAIAPKVPMTGVSFSYLLIYGVATLTGLCLITHKPYSPLSEGALFSLILISLSAVMLLYSHRVAIKLRSEPDPTQTHAYVVSLYGMMAGIGLVMALIVAIWWWVSQLRIGF